MAEISYVLSIKSRVSDGADARSLVMLNVTSATRLGHTLKGGWALSSLVQHSLLPHTLNTGMTWCSWLAYPVRNAGEWGRLYFCRTSLYLRFKSVDTRKEQVECIVLRWCPLFPTISSRKKTWLSSEAASANGNIFAVNIAQPVTRFSCCNSRMLPSTAPALLHLF